MAVYSSQSANILRTYASQNQQSGSACATEGLSLAGPMRNDMHDCANFPCRHCTNRWSSVPSIKVRLSTTHVASPAALPRRCCLGKNAMSKVEQTMRGNTEWFFFPVRRTKIILNPTYQDFVSTINTAIEGDICPFCLYPLWECVC